MNRPYVASLNKIREEIYKKFNSIFFLFASFSFNFLFLELDCQHFSGQKPHTDFTCFLNSLPLLSNSAGAK